MAQGETQTTPTESAERTLRPSTVEPKGFDHDVFYAPSSKAGASVKADTFFRETFTDNLGNWTRTIVDPTDTLIWYHRDPRTSPLKDTIGGRYVRRHFGSPTSATGFAMINFDSFDNKGGTIPDRDRTPVDQSLVSPTIDLANATGQLSIQFWQYFRYCCNLAANPGYISFSSDGGVTFEDEILATPNLAVNSTYGGFSTTRKLGAQNFVRIPTKYNGSTNFKFRFRYAGGYYAWAVDDIFITALPSTEVSLNADFIAVAPNARTPVSQVEGQNIYFVTDIQNNGGATQAPKVLVRIERIPASGPRVLYYTDSLQYPSIASDSVFDNNTFDKFVAMPTEPGTYRTTYTVVTRDSPDRDFLPANNSATYDFVVSDGARVTPYNRLPVLRGGSTPNVATGPGDWELGNIYYTPNLGTRGIRIDTLRAGFSLRGYDDNGDNALFELRTYGYKGDLDNNGIPKLGTDIESPDPADEFVLLGQRFYTITPNSTLGFQTLVAQPGEDEDFNPAPVVIPAGQGYIGYAVGVSYVQGSARGTTTDNFFMGNDGQFDGGAAQLVRDSIARRTNTPLGEEYATYGWFRATAEDPTFEAFGGAGFFLNTNITLLDSTSSVKNELIAREFSLSPNPANTEVSVAFDFGDNARTVTFTVTNGIGQQVMHINQAVDAAGRLTIPVENLNQGVYFVTATSESGASATRRVMIAR